MPDPLSDWSLLKVLLEVGRAGSLAGAAQVLAVSQPTIGRRVDELEQVLRTKLFIRTTQGITLTPAGIRLFGLAEKMEALALTVGAQATGEADLSGVVRCTVTDGIGGYWLPLMLEDFHAAHPHITLEVNVCDASVVPDLSRREADITVVYRPPTDPDVCVLAEDVAIGMPMASREYLDRYGQPETLNDLLEHRFCAHSMHFAPAGPWQRLAHLLRQHTKIVYRSNSSLAVCQAVRHGLGISYMPIGVMDREPDMVFFDIEGYAPEVPFWLVCHRDMKDLPQVRAMVNYIKKALFAGRSGSLSRRRFLQQPVVAAAPVSQGAGAS